MPVWLQYTLLQWASVYKLVLCGQGIYVYMCVGASSMVASLITRKCRITIAIFPSASTLHSLTFRLIILFLYSHSFWAQLIGLPLPCKRKSTELLVFLSACKRKQIKWRCQHKNSNNHLCLCFFFSSVFPWGVKEKECAQFHVVIAISSI